MAVKIDKLINPSSEGTSFHLCSNQNTIKRKRRISINSDDKNSDICFEVPLAKRQQRVPSYHPEPNHIVDNILNKSDSIFSCVQPGVTEFDMTSDNIPDSPNSLNTENNDLHFEKISPAVSSRPKNSCIICPLRQSACAGKQGTYSVISNTTEVANKGVQSFDEYVSLDCCGTRALHSDSTRICPFPAFSWANAQDVWQFMCKKDEEAACLRDSTIFIQHPSLKPRMRAILLDWLIEVCEVYKLHRETYYLAVDYLDRYLKTNRRVLKTHLQLIGITCLFIAAKVEEIYPPKIGEFAYVTDGACREEDILQHEILVLQELKWSISTVTIMSWLGIYMQLNVNNKCSALFSTNTIYSKTRNKGRSSITTEVENRNRKHYILQDDGSPPLPIGTIVNRILSDQNLESKANGAFIYPQFSGMEFVHTSQLLDLCSLDVSIGKYPYSIIAAAAISYTFNRETALRCSGLDWQCLEQCVRWMGPFFQAVCEESDHLNLNEHVDVTPSECGIIQICPNIQFDDFHIIQTHNTSMTMFDRALLIQEQQRYKNVASKSIHEASPGVDDGCPEGLLTPPTSTRKPFGADDKMDQTELINYKVTFRNEC